MFNAIRIVLIGTSHPGNVGAAARAMKTMGLSQLVLVDLATPLDERTTAMAAHADDVLAHMRSVATLDEAIGNCELVLGTSARSRYLDWPVLSPRDAARQVRQYLETTSLPDNAGRSVAILFGRERTGLTNEELQRCHAHIHIPTNPDYSSLNLASAVQLISYELRLALLAEAAAVGDHEALATAAEMQQLYTHLEQALTAIDFINPKAPKQVMGRLRRLLQRARCEQEEVNILRGLCSKILRNR